METAQPASRRFLYVVSALLAASLASLVGTAVSTGAATDQLLRQHEELRVLTSERGAIAHYDELLTLSAHLAAASGEPRWEDRYRKFEPELREILLRASARYPELAQTHAANDALVAAEEQAFALVKQGRQAEARQILDSPAYLRDKQAYIDGVSLAIARREAALVAQQAHQARWMALTRTLTWLAALTVLVLAVLLVRALIWSARRLEQANARLEERVLTRTEEITRQRDALRRLSQALLSAEDEERQRLAQALHDDLQQLLIIVQLRLGALAGRSEAGLAQELSSLAGILREALKASRAMVAELSPPALLGDGNVADALTALAHELQANTGLQVKVEAPAARPPPEVGRFLVRAARELLFNVARHAGTVQASVNLSERGAYWTLVVEDEGSGFDPSERWSRAETGFGLPTLRERARGLGGSFQLASRPGEGTRVTLVVPGLPRRDQERPSSRADLGPEDSLPAA